MDGRVLGSCPFYWEEGEGMSSMRKDSRIRVTNNVGDKTKRLVARNVLKAVRQYRALFEDVVSGLVCRGWKRMGGNDESFHILTKDGNTIKVFANDYGNPSHLVVRYSVTKDEIRCGR